MIKLNTKELQNLFFHETIKFKPNYFCEIGAREATASLFLAHNLENCEIYAYEANPYTHEIYKSHIHNRNKSSLNINYINLAISNYIGSVSFYIQKHKPKHIGNNSMLQRTKDTEYEILNIPCSTLDHLIYSFGSKYCLWIDAEGCGYEVLLGAKNILKNTGIIFIEVEGSKFWKNQKLDSEILLFLKSEGFVPIAYDSQYYNLQYNIIFKKLC